MTRTDLLIDLSDAINELTRPRPHVEYIETVVVQPLDHTGRRRKSKRTRVRKAHRTTMPPLLRQLEQAAVPGAGTIAGSPAGFESSPSAELEPLSVLRDITDRVGFWVRVFDLDDRRPLPELLSALVGAPHDDEQLTLIAMQAQRWVRDARLAAGLDAPPITLDAACPLCGRKNSLIIRGDLEGGKCSKCRAVWTIDTIGLLGEMLRANQDQEIMSEVRCWWPSCTRVAAHFEHQDNNGRTWRDTCEVPQAG